MRKTRSTAEGAASRFYERLRDTPRTPLEDEAFSRIVDATRLPRPTRTKLSRLRAELERLGTLWRIHNTLGPPLRPAREARRMRGIASHAARLDEALDFGALASLGDVIEMERGAVGDSEPSGFELVESDSEAVRRIMRLAQTRARSLDAMKNRAPPRRSQDTMRRETVRALARAFERAFGRPVGASRNGPGVRFVHAFFATYGRRVPERTVERWVRETR